MPVLSRRLARETRWIAKTSRWVALACFVFVIASLVHLSFHFVESSTTDAIHDSQLRACVRGNVVRLAVHRNSDAVRGILTTAVAARRASAKADSIPAVRRSDALAASRYERLLRGLVRVPERIDCDRAYPRP